MVQRPIPWEIETVVPAHIARKALASAETRGAYVSPSTITGECVHVVWQDLQGKLLLGQASVVFDGSDAIVKTCPMWRPDHTRQGLSALS